MLGIALMGWVPAQAGETVEVTDGAAKISVAEQGDEDQGTQLLQVTVTSGGQSASWKYNDLSLDPERTGKANAEIAQGRGSKYLFVHAYSGGASCCWSLLVFNLDKLQPLGSVLDSQSPIKLAKGVGACAVGAYSEPVSADGGEGGASGRQFSCFDGKGFVKAGSRRR